MFRSHGTDTPREIWRFGEPGELAYDSLEKFLKLRYRLLPYIYSLAGGVTQENSTMLRALAFDFRHDPATFNINDQFMFGPAFLVNPVTQPMYFGANSQPLKGIKRTRPVYLPAGSDWYDFWTGQKFEGGQTIETAAGLETMPLYVRAGSIVPLGPEVQFTGEQPGAALELRVYPGQPGRFRLYEDEGDNYNYEKGAFSTIEIGWDDANRTLTVQDRQGGYPGMPTSREFRVTLVGSDSSDSRTVRYEGKQVKVNL
jgi:alpha-D-xyloside xylohydrolase